MVTRGIHPDTLAAMAAGNFCPVVLVYMDWPGDPIRVHSNVGPIQFQGHEWRGGGRFGRISVPRELGGTAQSSSTLQWVGAPGVLDDELEADIRGRAGEVWYGVVTQRAGNVLIGQPFRAFTGYMDAMRDRMAREDGTVARVISITLANGPSQRLSVSAYHTDEDQRTRHATDTAGRLLLNAERRARDQLWPE